MRLIAIPALATVIAFFAVESAQARVARSKDYYLLGADGRLVKKLDVKPGEHIDAAHELILQNDRTALRALRWADRKTVWSYKGERGAFHGISHGIVILGGLRHYIGIDVAMGTQIYKVARDEYFTELGRLSRGSDDCWYLRDDGWGRQPRRTRLKRFDPKTGKTLWNIEIELPDRGPVILPGVARGKQGTFFFNRESGTPVKKITDDPEEAHALAFSEHAVFQLVGDHHFDSIKIYDPMTFKQKDEIQVQIPKDAKLREPPKHNRLLVATKSHLVVVDLMHKRVSAKIPWRVDDSYQWFAKLHQSKNTIIVSSRNGVQAMDPVSGNELWRHANQRLSVLGVYHNSFREGSQSEPEELAVLAALPLVVAINTDEGREQWRFRVPKKPEFPGGMMQIQSCPTGWLVTVTSELALR